jgi:hypothetical protein
MMNIKDVALELEDGFEEESASDTLVKSQSGGLFPARWTPTARARSVEFRRQFPADALQRYYYREGNPRE